MFQKLEEVVKKYDELNALLMNPKVIEDPKKS